MKAQKNTEQLVYIGVEVIKPSMFIEYLELGIEIANLCKENYYPYSFETWIDGFNIIFFYKIKSLDEIKKIKAVKKGILEKLSVDKYKRYNECIDCTESKTMITLAGLSYKPQEPNIDVEDYGYCHLQKIYVINGHETEVEELFQRSVAIRKESQSGRIGKFTKGDLGFQNPVYLYWQYGKTVSDFWNQLTVESENQSEEMRNKRIKRNKEEYKLTRHFETSYLRRAKALSYTVKE